MNILEEIKPFQVPKEINDSEIWNLSKKDCDISTLVRSHTEHNSALTEVDRKKERKRNFVSAKTGFITVFELVFSYFFFGIFYGFKVKTNYDEKIKKSTRSDKKLAAFSWSTSGAFSFTVNQELILHNKTFNFGTIKFFQHAFSKPYLHPTKITN